MRCAMVLALLSLAMAQGPSKSAGWAAYERANGLFTRQQFGASVDAVEESLRLDPNLVPALTLRAKLAMAAQRNDLAREDLERAVKVDPRSGYAQFLLGLVLYQLNELRLAVGPLETAARLNAKDPRAALYLGLTRESLGETAEAASLYQRAMRLEENSGQPQVETCLIASRLELVLDRVEQAERLVQKALRIDAASRDAHFEAARLAVRRGRYDHAVQEGTRALGLPAGETAASRIHALLARSYRALGQAEEATRHAALARQ